MTGHQAAENRTTTDKTAYNVKGSSEINDNNFHFYFSYAESTAKEKSCAIRPPAHPFHMSLTIRIQPRHHSPPPIPATLGSGVGDTWKTKAIIT